MYKKAYAWLIVLMSSLYLLYKYMIQVSPSVMTSDLMRQFNLHATGLGNLASCYFYTYLVVQFVAGPILDRYSPRIVSAAAILVMAGAVFGFAHASSLSQALIYRALMGVGAAFATVSYLKLAASWFSSKQYSLVAGLLATAASVGAMLGEAPLALAVTKLGWQHTLYMCAIAGLVISIIYALVVRDKDSDETSTEGPKHVSWSAIRKLLSSHKAWTLTFYSGLAWAPMAVFGGLWGDPFLQTMYGISNTQAASLITIAFLGLAIGGPLFGYLANRNQKQFKMMFIGLVLSMLALLVVLFDPIHNAIIAAIALFLFGMGTGAFMLGFALGRIWFGAALTASMVALVNTGDALFGAISEPIIGKLLDHFWDGKMHAGVRVFNLHNYHISMLMLPLYLICALLLLLWLKLSSSE